MNTIKTFFFKNQGTFFEFSKEDRGDSLPLPHELRPCVPILKQPPETTVDFKEPGNFLQNQVRSSVPPGNTGFCT